MDQQINILFVGDVMPGGVLPYRKQYMSRRLKDFMGTFDLRVGTLECAIGTDLPYDEDKMRGRKNIVHARDEDFGRIVEMGLDVVTLANNHVFDLGRAGLENTIAHLRRNGIKYCGAGMNAKEAAVPAVVTVKGKTIAFLAYCEYGSKWLGIVKKPTETEAGINLFEIDKCLSDIREMRQKYDYVFVLPHWGIEYSYLPKPECVEYCKLMIQAGADGIFCSHPHQIQPLVKYDGNTIAFSMGNYLFPDFYMQVPRPIWYPESPFDDSELERREYYPAVIDKPCIQTWSHLSRIGMAVSCRIAGRNISTRPKLTYTAKETNETDFYSKPGPILARMKWMGAMVMGPAYRSSYKAYYSQWNLLRRGFHVIKRLVGV